MNLRKWADGYIGPKFRRDMVTVLLFLDVQAQCNVSKREKESIFKILKKKWGRERDRKLQ